MASLDRALQAVDAGVEQLLEDLDALVRVDTSMPPGARYPDIVSYLEERLSKLGFVNERVDVPEQLWNTGQLPLSGLRTNLVSRRETGREPISVYGHMDVVPATSERWSHPPFKLTVRDGIAFGRGTSDMKGSLASLLLALQAATDTGLELRYDPVLLLCTDEEGGTYPGIRYLAEEGYIAGHLLCMDGHAEPRIWAGCCGLADIRITFKGISGHSGATAPASNAIEAAIPVMNSLMRLKKDVESRTSRMAAAPDSGRERVAAQFNLTVANGGTKTTTIPDRFDLFVNRRYLPEESFDAVLDEIEWTVVGTNEASKIAPQVELIAHLPPVRDPLGPHWPRWQQAMTVGFGFDRQAFHTYGASSSSDMGWVQAAGTREILLGGVGRAGNNIHGSDENVAVQDLVGFTRSLLCYLAADFDPDPNAPTAEGEN